MVAVKPIAISLGILMIIGIIIPVILSVFIDIDSPVMADSVEGISDFVEDGISLFTGTVFEISFNPFDALNSETQETLINSFAYMSLLPDWILIPVIILCVIGLIFGVLA